jgi:MraZ protein
MKLEASIEARIAERTALSAEAMDYYETFYLPGAQECQVDPQGRLLVPATLRLYAGLVKDVVFTGARTKFRIWDRPKYEAVRDAGEQLGAGDPKVRNELGL